MRGLRTLPLAVLVVATLSSCVAIPIGPPDERTGDQKAVTVGLLPGIGAAWYAGGSVEDGDELNFGELVAEATLWPVGILTLNTVTLLIPTGYSWWRLPSDGWDPPRYRDRNEICELSLIGACKTTKPPPEPRYDP